MPDQLKLKNFEHDNYEDSMCLEDKEIEFWNRTGYDPTLIWNGFKTKDDDEHGLLHPEIYQHGLDFLSAQMVKAGKPRIKSINEKLEKGDYLLIKNFLRLTTKATDPKPYVEEKYVFKIGKYWLRNRYDIGFYNGEFIEILREDVHVPLSDTEKGWIDAEKKEEEELAKLRVEDESFIKENRERLEKERAEKIEYWKQFKEKHNIPIEIEMDYYLENAKNADKAFNDFIKLKNREFEPEAYYDESDL